MPPLYDDATAKRIDTCLDTAFTQLMTGVFAGNFDPAKDQYKSGIQDAVNLIVGGTNTAATANLLTSLGIFQTLDATMVQLKSGKSSAQDKTAALLEATGKSHVTLFQSYAREVPSPDEGNRPNDQSLAQFRLTKLLERIRA